MYSQFYFDKNLSALIGTEKDYYNDLGNDFAERLSELDRYIYLIQMFQILDSCAKDFLSFSETKKNCFWKINKYLLNYANAVYSYKEYISCYTTQNHELNRIQDNYYCSLGKYRFVCEYRNRIVHQSAVIKDMDVSTGDAYIDLLELISYFRSLIIESKNPKQIAKNKRVEEYIQYLESYQSNSIMFQSRPYLSAKQIVSEANKEICEMNEKLCLHLWNSSIKENFDWIYNKLYEEGQIYRTTFAVKDNDPETRINLTYVFEEYFVTLLMALGPDSNIVQEMKKYYEDKNYQYFLTYKRNLDDLIDGVRLLIEDNM